MIETVMLDFGNVIYSANAKLALIDIARFAKQPEKILNLGHKDFNSAIETYERGLISSEQFYIELTDKFDLNCSLDEFCSAWNSILVGLYDYSLEAILKLKSKYKLFILSNTSPLHYDIFEPQCREIFKHFDHLYFSHQIGKRKPKLDAYQYVLEHSGQSAESILFADDLQENLSAFEQIGGKTVLIHSNYTLMDLANTLIDN